ncbi:MAG: OmpA family protein [Burkholderiales bacterium]|jgi:outer membrane protein OmpA-like peptidoglycan-associated protein|nr:MAG: OmpA family protein [Burkholderiales bacterium]
MIRPFTSYKPLLVMLAMSLSACAPLKSDRPEAQAGSTEAGQDTATVTPGAAVHSSPQPRPTTPVEPSAMTPVPAVFEDAVARASEQLFRDAEATLGKESRTLVIDPLIDANTGAQTVSTAKMGSQLESAIKRRHAEWQVQPLTRQALASQPLLLIGTLTPVNTDPAYDTQPDAFRIWLTLIDLKTRRVVAKRLDRATVGSVNPEPLAYYKDSPTWHKDKTVSAYINSCQKNTQVGDLADPDYMAHLPAAAVINEATMAYGEGKLPQANKLYKEAATIADEGDLRVLNGLYLTNWQLGQKGLARDAFYKIVASGIDARKLPIKLLFQPGRTTFTNVGDLPDQYALWLNAVAEQATHSDVCMKIVGHTSRTGSAALNESLSRRRAEAIEKLLTQKSRVLGARLSSDGVGSREALIGLGTDDLRDALDRRVEFRVVDCG